MSAAIVSAFHHDYRDLYKGLQSHHATTDFRQQVSALERQITGQLYAASSLINIPAVTNQVKPATALSKLPNFSAIKSPKPHAPLTSSNSVATCNAASHLKSTSSTREHRKLDRSVSEPTDRSQTSLRACLPNSSRYKTELCRPYEENGTCKYGDKCQFAHGVGELRTLTRHPKYKTELCRTFHTTGFCPYGPRCHFIHNSEDSKKCLLNTLQNSSNVGANISVSPPKLSPSLSTLKDLEISNFNLSSVSDLSPTSSSSSGSPTSSLGGLFMDDSQLYNIPQVPQTAPPTLTNNFFFGSDYNPALASLSKLVSQPEFSSKQGFDVGDNMTSSIDKLISDMDNLNCLSDDIKSETHLKTEESDTLDINRNIIRLPIFSRFAH